MKRITLIIIGLICLSPFTLAEDKPTTDAGVSLQIPKLTAEEKKDGPELTDGGVFPPWGEPCTNFTYHVIYKDEKGRAPEYVRIWHQAKWYDLKKEEKEGQGQDYRQRVQYTFNYVPTSGQSIFYFFEASNGAGKARSNIIDSPDQGPMMYTESFDNNQLILLHKDSNIPLWTFNLGKEQVGQVALSKDGEYAGVATTRSIYLFSTKSQEPLWKFCVNCEEPFFPWADYRGIAISADGNYLAASLDNTLYFFEKESNQPVWSADIESGAIGIDISDDGEYIAVGVGNALEKGDKIFLFSKEGKKLWEYKASHPDYQQTGNFYRPDITPDGRYIAVSTGCPDRRAYLFSNDGSLLFRSEMLTEDSPVHKSALSDDGNLIAYSLDHQQGEDILVLFSKEGKKHWSFSSSQDGTARAVSISADGEYIALGTTGGHIYLFSKENNRPLWKFSLSGYFTQVGDVALSPAGDLLAAGTTTNEIYLFSKNSNKPVWEYQTNTWINALAFNGKYILAGTGMLEYVFEGNSVPPEEVECKEILEPYSFEKMKKSLKGDEEAEPEKGPAVCGDTICDDEKESYMTCPQDCMGNGEEDKKDGEKKDRENLEESFCPKFDFDQEACLAHPDRCIWISDEEICEDLGKITQKETLEKKAICGNNICEPPEETKDSCCEDCGKCKISFWQRISDWFRSLFG